MTHVSDVLSERRKDRWRQLIAMAWFFVALQTVAELRAEPPTLTGPGPPLLRPGTLTVTSPVNQRGTVYLRWEGTIAAPMARDIEQAFEAFKATRTRFVLILNSSGGSVGEGERTIALLKKIRATHRLDTVVDRGARCGSMCVPVYLQGEGRFGARSSAWLFHEVTREGSLYGRRKKAERQYTRLVDTYMVPAGVSKVWIDRMLPLIIEHDWWQTGDNLINDGANIITRPLENRTKRNLEQEMMLPQAPTGAVAAQPPATPAVATPTAEPPPIDRRGDGKPSSR